jgi:hypothetical protein
MMKDINELCGLETPTIDKVVTFFQKFLGKEYIVNGALNGRNAAETKAPPICRFSSTATAGMQWRPNTTSDKIWMF